MSKISVTTIAGLTSGGDANTVKIESGDAFQVVSGATTLGGNVTVTGDIIKSTSGTSNFAAGVNAGNSIASGGNYNVVIGDEAGTAITTGDGNVAVGFEALSTEDTQGNSTAVGYHALKAQNASATAHNTAVGYQAGLAITDGTNNTIFGAEAGITITSAASNTFVGHEAGQLTNSDKNTFVGRNAGHNITSGAKNTIIGRFNGNENGLDIRTSSNFIVLSDGDGNPREYFNQDGLRYQYTNINNYRIALFENTNNTSGNGTINSRLPSNCNNTSSYHFVANTSGLGDALYMYGNGNLVNASNSYGAMSDEKLKENIVDSGSQWDDIKAIKVRKYSMKVEKADKPTKIGVIAQELETAGMSGLVFETPDRDEDGKDLKTTTKVVNYSVLYMKAIKALQESLTRIETLETKVKALESK